MIYFPSCVRTCSELPSDIDTMLQTNSKLYLMNIIHTQIILTLVIDRENLYNRGSPTLLVVNLWKEFYLFDFNSNINIICALS